METIGKCSGSRRVIDAQSTRYGRGWLFPHSLIFIGAPRPLRRQKGARAEEHAPRGAL